MNKRKANIPQEAEGFHERVDALLDAFSQRETSVIEDELRAKGIDPEKLTQTAHTRLREMAAHRYLSLGKDVPPLLQEAVRQLRPPAAEEVEEREQLRASSKVKELLDSIKTGAAAILNPITPDDSLAPAFRRSKKQPLSDNDREILEKQQSELDTKPRNERGQNG